MIFQISLDNKGLLLYNYIVSEKERIIKVKKRILAGIALAAASIMTISGCSFLQPQNTNALGTYDFTQMNLIQCKEPVEGQDVAVIETNKGTMTAVLYTEYAPKTIENFKIRVEEGFYNGKPFFALQQGIYGLTGASNEEGTEGITQDGNFIPNECSVDLWPFKGALLSYSSKMGYSDSRFFFCGALEITEENFKELRGYQDKETGEQIIPEELLEQFVKRGSVPGFAGSYTVFGQVINGFDVLDEILWTTADKKTMKPTEELIITKITLDTYAKDKFELEEPTADKFVTAEEIEQIPDEMNSQANN